MSLFHAKTTPFFLHKNAKPQTGGEFDVILSPQYYWVKKVALPVKKVSDARKLAESVFEGSLPEGEYSYEVSKAADGDFILIAYDRKNIAEVIDTTFVEKAKVKHVYFAQFACRDLDSCCSIDETGSLVNLDNLLMHIPRNCTDPKLSVDDYLQGKKLTGPQVKLGSLDVEVVDRRTFALMATAAGLFLIALGIGYADYKHAASQLEEQKQALIQKYDLPPTTMQLESIRKRLLKTYKTQKRIREALYQLSGVTLPEHASVKNLDIDSKSADVAITLSKPEQAEALKSQFAQKFKVLDSSVDANTLHIKIAV